VEVLKKGVYKELRRWGKEKSEVTGGESEKIRKPWTGGNTRHERVCTAKSRQREEGTDS